MITLTTVFKREVRAVKNGDMKEKELIVLLGADKLKNIGEQLAEIVRQHNLQRSPDVCRKLFDYFSDVITGWNCV